MDSKKAEYIRSFENEDGVILPSSLIEAGRDPKSPIHNDFTWNDDKAAHKCRLDEARALIRSVKVVIHDEKVQIKTVAYVRNPEAGAKEQGYTHVAKLRTRKARARDALRAELERAESALQRAYDVAGALKLSNEVEGMLAQVRNVKEAV